MNAQAYWTQNRYLEPKGAFYQQVTPAVCQQLEAMGFQLGPDDSVFEPGCNMGRHLRALQQWSNCRVAGMDISPHAVANRLVGDITRGDVLTDWNPEESFTLIFTHWFLIHIPASPEKTALIERMKDRAGTVLLLEPVQPRDERPRGCVDHGDHCLSWDDWTQYGFTDVQPNLFKQTSVFIWRKDPVLSGPILN